MRSKPTSISDEQVRRDIHDYVTYQLAPARFVNAAARVLFWVLFTVIALAVSWVLLSSLFSADGHPIL